MKEELYDDIFEDKEEQIDFKASLFKYIIRWPWFVASVIVCMACAWIYLKQSTPAYNINASILIKDEKKGGMLGIFRTRRPWTPQPVKKHRQRNRNFTKQVLDKGCG